MTDDADQIGSTAWALERLRKRYEGGQRDALLEAIAVLLYHREIETPAWIEEAWRMGMVRWKGFESRTVGDAFGIDSRKGINLKAARRRQGIKNQIYLRIYDLHEHHDEPLDSQLFEKVGQELDPPRCKTFVEECYYEVIHRIKASRP